MHQHLETLKDTRTLQAIKPVADYVYKRRGRFSALATVVVLSPWLAKRPHTEWTEFQKDFRMYDQMSKKSDKQ